jgi:D-alanine transaminase
MPLTDARVGVEDRGFQFADGVYEVARIYGGRCFALRDHLQRLERSAGAIQLKLPVSIDALRKAIDQFAADGNLADGLVYLQVTRGCSPRNHLFPECDATMLFYTRELPPVLAPGDSGGERVWSVEDDRWNKCWIKSIALLPNILARNEAARAGADEAVFVNQGVVTEGASTNLFAVIDGTLVTHPAGARVLPGITRAIVLAIASDLEIPISERPPTLHEVQSASEAFLTGTTRELIWISHWNDRKIWPECGPVTQRLHRAYQEKVAIETAVIASCA